jgi:hypothetical protein
MQSLNKNDIGEYIEGPCNLVHKVFSLNEENIKEVKDYVILPDFSFDLLDTQSRLYLRKKIKQDEVKWRLPYLTAKNVYSCPRVGLTLKKYDIYKEKFWMADYRFFTHPERIKKMNIFIILAMIKAGMSISKI